MKMDMNMGRGFFAIFFSVLMCSMGFAALHLIPQGTPTVDGVLSPGEWDGAVWINMGTSYSGYPPADVAFGRWTAKWSPTTNLIYVAVEVFDSNHFFADSWGGACSQDYVSICVDANNSSAAGQSEVYDNMQKWDVGLKPDGATSWAALKGSPVPGGDIAAYAAKAGDSILTYEIAIRPYAYYTGGGGGKKPANVVSTLAAGNTIGLDVVATSLSSLSTVGQIANDINADKFDDASQLIKHRLSGQGKCINFNNFDFNQDCYVNFGDFAAFAMQLVNQGNPISSMYPPVGRTWYSAGTWSKGSASWWFYPQYWTYNPGSVSCVFTGDSFWGNGVRLQCLGWNSGTNHSGALADIFVDGVKIGRKSFWATANNTPMNVDVNGIAYAGAGHVITAVNVDTNSIQRSLHFVRFETLNPGIRTITGSWSSGATWVYSGDATGVIQKPGDPNTSNPVTYVSCPFTTSVGSKMQVITGGAFDNGGLLYIWIDYDKPGSADRRLYGPFDQSTGYGQAFPWTSPAFTTAGSHSIKVFPSGLAGSGGTHGTVCNWNNFILIR